MGHGSNPHSGLDTPVRDVGSTHSGTSRNFFIFFIFCPKERRAGQNSCPACCKIAPRDSNAELVVVV